MTDAEWWCIVLGLPPTLSDEQVVREVEARLRLNKYMGGHAPTVPQAAFLISGQREVLYGGATKGGKSDAMLMAALQYVDVPYYNALILHRTFTDLSKGDALIPRFRDWTGHLGVKWDDENHAGIFPSGAKVSFGFVDTKGAGRRYKGPNYQFIGWEELTEQPDPQDYTFLFSRLARPAGSQVPIRVRATTNPDGPGHDWVKLRWGLGHDDQGRPLPKPDPETRIFIPAKLEDNPHVDQAEIEEALVNLDDVEYAQIRHGEWDVAPSGDFFVPEMIRILPDPPTAGVSLRYRGWDKAGTDASERGAKRAKFTVGLRVSRVDRRIYGVEFIIEDLIREQWGIDRRDRAIQETAGIYAPDIPASARLIRQPDPWQDGGQRDTWILIEQEPADAGKQSALISVSQLNGRVVEVFKPSTDKETRARAAASQINAGNYGMVRAWWNRVVLNELRAFPSGPYKDIVDTLSMIHNKIALSQPPALPASSRGVSRHLALPAPYAPARRTLPPGVGVPPGINRGPRG